MDFCVHMCTFLGGHFCSLGTFESDDYHFLLVMSKINTPFPNCQVIAKLFAYGSVTMSLKSFSELINFEVLKLFIIFSFHQIFPFVH